MTDLATGCNGFHCHLHEAVSSNELDDVPPCATHLAMQLMICRLFLRWIVLYRVHFEVWHGQNHSLNALSFTPVSRLTITEAASLGLLAAVMGGWQ